MARLFVCLLVVLLVVTDAFVNTFGTRKSSVFAAYATTASPPKIQLSPLVENMAVSKTIEIHSLTKEMEKNGQTVYSLCVGEPDYQPPAEVLAATVRLPHVTYF